MTCICFENKNKILKEKNARLVLASRNGRVVCFVATEKLDKENPERIPILEAEYCPFCGKLLEQ